MRLRERIRRIPTWVRIVIGVHIFFLLLGLGAWGVLEAARREIVVIYTQMFEDPREQKELFGGDMTAKQLHDELQSVDVDWDEKLGLIFRFKAETEAFTLEHSWSVTRWKSAGGIIRKHKPGMITDRLMKAAQPKPDVGAPSE